MVFLLPFRAGPAPNAEDNAGKDAEVESGTVVQNEPQANNDLGPAQAIRTLSFWVLFLVFGITIGGDIGTTHTFAGVVASRGKDKMMTQLGVIAFSAADASMRFLSGVATARGLRPTVLFICSPLLMAVGQAFLLISVNDACFFMACVALGFSDGIGWTIGPLL